MAGKILVGTSSWADPGFVREWYPPKMSARERLPWYAERFEYVELNSSFYAVPDRNTVHKWVEETPDGFVFDVKAHRLLSRHSAQVESLPPELREQAQVSGRGRVTLTPELETALARRLVEETPDGFVFDVKAHRLLSRHSAQLEVPTRIFPATWAAPY